MLIDYGTFDTIQTAVIVTLFAGGLLLIVLAFFLKRLWPAVTGAVLMPLAAVAIVLPDSFTMDVFTAAPGAKGPEIARSILVGRTKYRFAGGKEIEIAANPGLTQLVLNDSTTPLVIIPVEYSETGIAFDEPKTAAHIAPHSALYTKLFIQDYGKGEHRPPPTTQGVAVETRYWLTWE